MKMTFTNEVIGICSLLSVAWAGSVPSHGSDGRVFLIAPTSSQITEVPADTILFGGDGALIGLITAAPEESNRKLQWGYATDSGILVQDTVDLPEQINPLLPQNPPAQWLFASDNGNGDRCFATWAFRTEKEGGVFGILYYASGVWRFIQAGTGRGSFESLKIVHFADGQFLVRRDDGALFIDSEDGCRELIEQAQIDSQSEYCLAEIVTTQEDSICFESVLYSSEKLAFVALHKNKMTKEEFFKARNLGVGANE